MRVTIGPLGPAGGRDACIGLGLALRDRGHAVSLAGSDDTAAAAEAWQFRFRGICDDLQPFLAAAAVARSLRLGDCAQFERIAARYAHAARSTLRTALLEAYADADVIVAPAFALVEAMTAADILAKPLVLIAATPSIPPSWYLAQPFVAARPSRLAPLNRLTHARYDRRISSGLRRSDDVEWRILESLAPVRRRYVREAMHRRIPQLHVYSSSLVSRGADWPGHVHSVGRITTTPARKFAAGRGRLPEDLTDWLDAGPPPVALALANWWSPDSAADLRIALRLSRILGVRVVIRSRHLSAEATPDAQSVYVAADADADALFVRCRAVVHRGDADTTATAARAGAPAVVCSSFGDGPMWGERVRALRIGEHLTPGRFDAGHIAGALRRLDRSAVRQRTREIGACIAAEDGVPGAIAAIERIEHGTREAEPARGRSTLR